LRCASVGVALQPGVHLLTDLLNPNRSRNEALNGKAITSVPAARIEPARLRSMTRFVVGGGRVQLEPTLDVNTLGLSPAGVTIARALQRYGAFIADYSGSMSLYVEASADARAYWSSGVLDNREVQNIPLDRFRVLEIGTLYDNGN
jgi:hypothetical protein